MELRTDHPLDSVHTCRASLRIRLEIARQAEAAGVKSLHGGMSDAEAVSARPVAEMLAESDARVELLREKGRRLAERFPMRRAAGY